MSAKELMTGIPLASLLWLAPMTIGCGHAAGTATPPTTGKGYHAAAAAPATPPPAAAPAPAPAAVPSPTPVAPAAPTPSTTVVLAQPSTLPPPRRAYEPPMPLEPGRSSAVGQPVPAYNNGPNTTATGQRFAVQGVDPSDVLNIRSGPSATYEIVGTIPPDGSGVIPLGGRRQIGPSVWREVSYRGVRGWVNDRFLIEERARSR